MSARETFDGIATERDEDSRWELLRAFVIADPRAARQAASPAIAADSSHRREAAADVLGQVSTVDHEAASGIAGLLRARLVREGDPAVLASVIFAIGHTRDGSAKEAVIAHARHRDPTVRFAVACSLPALDLDDEALGALRELSADTDSDVRDWATFGLAESAAADPATVEALAARSADPDDDTRAEGIYGLARRRDPRARTQIERELAQPVHGSLIERALDELNG